MSEALDARLTTLRTAMQLLPTGIDELLSFAAAGEAVRRAISTGEHPPHSSEELRDEYVRRLRDRLRKGVSGVETLGAKLDAALGRLEEYGSARLHARSRERGELLFEEIDRVLALCGAGAREGIFPQDLRDTMAERARARVHDLAPRLSDLWEAAAWRQALLGPDPDDSTLYGWLTELASLSQTERAITTGTTARSEKARSRLIDEILSRAGGARVIRVEFRRPAPRMELAAHAPGELHEDPGKAGEVVYSDDVVEIRVIEIVEGDAGLFGVRVRLMPTISGDLGAKGAVVVRPIGAGGAPGAPLRPTSGDYRPLVWWATFAASGRLSIAIPELSVEHELEVVRPKS